MRIVDGSHERRGYSLSERGYHIAYHYFIGTDGTIVQTRNDSERTMHTRNDDINLHSIAIVLAGDFQHDEINKRQLYALKQLVTMKQKEYGIPREHVIPHREASATACPGANIMKMLWPQ